jgi:thiol-disulfide isomerase/thioredoxin
LSNDITDHFNLPAVRILTLLSTLLLVIPSFGQVKFEDLSLDEAVSKAAQSGKIVFAQFVDERCPKCNEMADSSFREPRLAKLVEQKCIAIKIDYDHADRASFIEEYNTSKMAGTYFFSGQGDLIHAYRRAVPVDSIYVREIKRAYDKQVEGNVTFEELNKEWNEHADNIPAMERNLEKRLAVGLKTDSLLEVYISRLPGDSLKSARVVKKIMWLAPDIFSPSYSVATRDTSLVRQAWNELSKKEHQSIYARTIKKSMHKAIAKRSETMAVRVASYAAGRKDPLKAAEWSRRFTSQMLGYYLGVRDTIKFLSTSKGYLSAYVLTINKDDLQQDTTRKADYYACQLYKCANVVYHSRYRERYLNDAISWVEKSKSLVENHYNTNLHAWLLYSTNHIEEAIQLETKALEMVKDNRYYSGKYSRGLANMKQGLAMKD